MLQLLALSTERLTRLLYVLLIIVCSLSHFHFLILSYIQVFQATGGMTGRYISSYLDELHIEHVTSESIIFSLYSHLAECSSHRIAL